MSVNIKTASGLQKLSSNVTKNTIADALGYTPANPDSVTADLRAHTSDTNIHVTLAEKDKFTDYKQLKNTPNITDDLSGDFSIVDSRGNAALQVDSTGTTNVAKLNVNGQDVGSFMESTNATSNTHITDGVRHITADERTHWNDKSKLEGAIQIQDSGNNFTILDNVGNAALQITEDGTTDVAKLTIKGADVEKTISDAAGAVAANLTNHSTATNGADGSIHIQPGERAKWNDTSKMEGNLQLQDEGKEFVISDNSGNVALQVTESGITQVAELEINGLNTSNEIARVESQAAANLSAHNTSKLPAGDSKHIQEGERALWNDKQHLSGNIKIDDEGSEFVLTDKAGNVAFQVVSTGTTQIADLEINGVNTTNEIARVEGAASSNLYAHTSRTDNPHHITKAQVGLSNADNTSDADKPISTAQAVKNEALDKRIDDAEAALQTHKTTTVSDGAIHIQESDRTRWDDKSWHSLTDKPNIVNNDESDEFQILDGSGNVAVVVDATGVTNVAKLSIQGSDVIHRIDTVESDARTNLSNHTTRTDNPHAVTASQVGLGNVNNTSDADKPISNAQAAVNDTLQQGIDANAAAINSIKNGTDDAVAKNAEHAEYADVWTSPRTVTFGKDNQGDVTGTFTIDGSQDVACNLQVRDDSHNHLINPTAQTNSDGPLTFTSDSGNCAVTYTVNHKTSSVTAGTYTRVTVDKYGHITSGETPDASWSSIVGRPDITPTADGNDTEVIIKDNADNVAFQFDSTGTLNLAAANINGVSVAVDYIDYAQVAFDTEKLVV